MRKLAFIILLSLGCLVASQQDSYAQTEPDASASNGNSEPAAKVKKKKGKKGQTQADLDAQNGQTTENQMTPEAKAYQKQMAKNPQGEGKTQCSNAETGR